MNKTLAFKLPPKAAEQQKNDWVEQGVEPHLQPRAEPPVASKSVPAEPTKRLTIDIPKSLHTRVKIECAKQDVYIADEVRAFLERRFPTLS